MSSGMISVIIPVYNNAYTVRESVASVVRAVRHFGESMTSEIILVDDCSTDNTRDVLDEICEESERNESVSVRLIHLLENAGPAGARNAGLKEAQGEYVMFVDADDTLDADAIATLYSAVPDENGDAENVIDIVVAGLRRVRHNDNGDEVFEQIEAINRLIKDKNGCDVMSVRNDFFSMLDAGILNSPCAKLYRRSIITEHDVKMPTELDMGEDFQFNLRFLRYARKIRLVPKSLYTYEVEKSTLTYRYRENLFMTRKVSVDMLRQFLIDMELDEDICFYLYEKLLISQTMQDIKTRAKRTDMNDRIRTTLKSDEINESIAKIQPNGKMERAVAFAVGSRNIMMIRMFSRIALAIRNRASDNIARVSI